MVFVQGMGDERFFVKRMEDESGFLCRRWKMKGVFVQAMEDERGVCAGDGR